MTDLEPISPDDAIDLYLDERKEELRYESIRNIENGLDVFSEWVEDHGLEDMNDLGGRDLLWFKRWRKDSAPVNKISLNGNLAVLRRFLVFCVSIDAVEEGLPDDVPTSNVSDDEEVRDKAPSDEQVEAVSEYLSTYEYASRRHVEHELIKETSIRLGAVRAIDVDDYDPDEKRIKLRHRPEANGERGTPLKNGSSGERNINISGRLRDLIDDFLANPDRPEGTDRYGREPLFTTRDSDGSVGRVSVGRIRDDLYIVTRPCEYGDNCPIGRDVDECRAAKNRYAYDCPETYTPHPLRSWSIMRQLDEGIAYATLSDRADVSVPVLKKHYDNRSKERKRLNRRDELASSLPEYGESSDASLDGPPVLSHPAMGILLVGFEFGKWIYDRLRRELSSMSPAGKPVRPGPRKAVKGIAAYVLFVALTAVNLLLFGNSASLTA